MDSYGVSSIAETFVDCFSGVQFPIRTTRLLSRSSGIFTIVVP